MKVLFLLSLILVVCYSHTRLRTHPLIQPITDKYPYQPDLTTSKDNGQLDFQRAFPAAKEGQINLLKQDFDYLDANLARTTYSTSFNDGVAAILTNARSRGFISSPDPSNFNSVATSLQKQSRGSNPDIYQFQFRLDDNRGTTIVGYFNIKNGFDTLESYNYNVMTVRSNAVNQGPYVPQSTPLDPSSRVAQAYDSGVDRIKALLVTNGDVDASVSLNAELNSVQLQLTGESDSSYLFQVTLSHDVELVVTASFTVAVRPDDATNYFTDYSYYVQRNQVTSSSAEAATVEDVASADSGPTADAFAAGVSALTDIAISQNDLTSGGTLTKQAITNLQKQTIGVNTNYIFQATLTSNQNSIFAVNLVVTHYYNGTNKLTAFAYNLLSNTSYVTANPGRVVTLDPAAASQSPHSETLQFGVRALLEAAKARNDVPSNYPDSNVVVTAFQSQVISEDDVTYTFQVRLNDTLGTVVAASISVTIRNNNKLLTAYAYNVVSTSTAQVQAASSETLDTGLANTNSDVASFLTYGVDRVKEIAIERGDLAAGTTFVRVIVLKLQKQTTGRDLAYIFQANLDTGTGVVLAASLSVTLRAYNAEKYLTAYAYSQQVSNSKSVYPLELSRLDVNLVRSNTTINAAYAFGLQELIKIAINSSHLEAGFVRTETSTVALSLKVQTIGDDVAYYFQVRFSDSNNVIVSASFTVTIRFALGIKILSAYAYNIQRSTITSVQAQAAQDIPLNALQSNQDVINALEFGLGALAQIAIHKGDLAAGDSVAGRSVTSIKQVLTGNDATLIFQVYANTTRGLQLSASLSVTRRPSYTLGRILSGYAYIVQEANITRVNPVASNLALSAADQDLISSGIDQLRRIAENAGHIPENLNFQRDIANFSAVNTGRDVTYIFQVYLRTNTDRRGLQFQVAASVSVTRRAVTNTVYLTAYAYNVLNTTLTSNTPDDFAPVEQTQQNSGRYQPLLDFGASLVKSLAQLNNDLVDASKLTAQTLVSVRTQNQASDYSYSFQVEFTDHQGAGLAATFTVTYRNADRSVNNGYILVNYAYNSLNTTLGSVSTVVSNTLTDDDKTEDFTVALFRSGYEHIIAAAKANGQIDRATNFTRINIISGQKVTLGDFSGFQFQANLDNGNGVTIGAAFTVVNMGADYGGNVVSNYAYNAQIVKKAYRQSS